MVHADSTDLFGRALQLISGILALIAGIMVIIFRRRFTEWVARLTGIEPGKPIPFGSRPNSIPWNVFFGITACCIGIGNIIGGALGLGLAGGH